MSDIDQLLIDGTATVLDAIAAIDRNRKGAVIVVDAGRRLRGVVTDGDIRRAILAGLDLTLPVERLLERRTTAPISAAAGLPASEQLAVLRRHRIRHLPLIDGDRRVVDLLMLDDVATPAQATAVVMAGGLGTRLRPLTHDVPKSMLPVDGRPLLERLVAQLSGAGIEDVHVATHYKAESIREHFGDGERFGVRMKYLHEEIPLGTAGALGQLAATSGPLLVINGDILTQVDFAALFAFYADHDADAVVGVRQYRMDVPYGVIHVDDINVVALEEKPTLSYFVNAGIYVISPAAQAEVPRDGRRFDMTDLIQVLIARQRRVVSFPIREYWLDIGQMDDYARAQADAASWEVR